MICWTSHLQKPIEKCKLIISSRAQVTSRFFASGDMERLQTLRRVAVLTLVLLPATTTMLRRAVSPTAVENSAVCATRTLVMTEHSWMQTGVFYAVPIVLFACQGACFPIF